MHTSKERPGKFEGNRSQMLAEAVYNRSLDGSSETAGDVSELGWFAALVEGKNHDFILVEDSDGFVDVEVFSKGDRAVRTNWEAYLNMESEAVR